MKEQSVAAAGLPDGILQGLRVVDLTRHRAGAVAGLLLAELGSEVVRLRLAVDRGREMDPVHDALWNRSKARADIDLGEPAGRQRLTALLDGADAVLVDRTPAEAAALGLDESSLCRDRPALIYASIGSWPAGHPKSGQPLDDLLVLAESGLLDEQMSTVRDGPAFIGFPLGSAHASFLAAVGVVVRLMSRRQTGRGGTVGTSLVQGAMLPAMMYWWRAANMTPGLHGCMGKDAPQPQFQCQDGLWLHLMDSPAKLPQVRAMLDEMGPEQVAAADDAYYGARPRTWPNLGALSQIFRRKPRDAWLQALWEADLPVQAVAAPGAIFEDEQARANGYVQEVVTAQFGPTLQAATPLHLSPPPRVRYPGAFTGWTPRDEAQRTVPPAGPHPLSGITVLDFGAYLAGPLAPMLLADLGADVIKIEPLTADPLRRADWVFNACQRGKRNLALDLTRPASREIVARLVRRADVVHHNQRMSTAQRLGIDYESLKAVKSDIVYTHVSAYGPAGPRRLWPGYDQLFQALSGWQARQAGEGNPPLWLRFGMMDHLAALGSLLGTVSALYARQVSGEGQFVAASLLGASLFTVDTALASGKLLACPEVDVRQMGTSPVQRLYPCADGWLAVSDRRADAEARMLAAAGCKTVAALEAQLSVLPVDTALALLGAAGIGCATVARGQRDPFFDDADNRAVGLTAAFMHPIYGTFEQAGSPWQFGGHAPALQRPAPLLGQDSRAILLELGFGEQEIEQMRSEGVVHLAG